MKKVFVSCLLAVALAGTLMRAQDAPKQIQNKVEYDTYMAAFNTADPGAKAAAFEAFVSQYPGSVVKVDALEQAMAAYQQAGNAAKVESVARTILGIDGKNIRALAIVAYLDRFKATTGDAAALKEACLYAGQGIEQLPRWSRAEGMTDADLEKLRKQMSGIFEGVAGFCALQNKDYVTASGHYLKSVEIDPTNMQDVYQLGIAGTLMKPIDLNGFWYMAKAINLANAQKNDRAAQGIAAYAKAKYRQYHGSEEGWEQLLARVERETAPPASMAAIIKPAPTSCEIAAQAVAENKVEELSFSDREFILSQRDCGPQGKDAADKVWQGLQAMEKGGQAKLQLPVKVISSTETSLEVAITDENQSANKADMHVALQKPMATPPAAGSSISVIGVITSYKLNPFMFMMERGNVP